MLLLSNFEQKIKNNSFSLSLSIEYLVRILCRSRLVVVLYRLTGRMRE